MKSFSSRGISPKNPNAHMTPGERVKAKLTSFTVDKDDNVIIVFKNETGTLKVREWKVDPDHSKYDEDQANNRISRIKHILCAYMDEEAIDNVVAEDFGGWAKQCASMLDVADTRNKEVELKVVVNKREFIDFPYLPDFISSEFRPLQWTSNPKYDKYTYSPKAPDVAPDAAAEEIPASEEEDLNF